MDCEVKQATPVQLLIMNWPKSRDGLKRVEDMSPTTKRVRQNAVNVAKLRHERALNSADGIQIRKVAVQGVLPSLRVGRIVAD